MAREKGERAREKRGEEREAWEREKAPTAGSPDESGGVFLHSAKELKAQMAEREAKQYDEALRDAEITNRMKLETERAVELDKKKEEERYADQIRYQQVL